jgi:integrase
MVHERAGRRRPERSGHPVDSAYTVDDWSDPRLARSSPRVGTVSHESAWENHGLAFAGERGTFVDDHAVYRHFTRLCTAAGVPRIRIHDLRHTSATLLIQSGIPIKAVSERLGHLTITITLQTYGHVGETLQRQAGDVMDSILKRRDAASG